MPPRCCAQCQHDATSVVRFYAGFNHALRSTSQVELGPTCDLSYQARAGQEAAQEAQAHRDVRSVPSSDLLQPLEFCRGLLSAGESVRKMRSAYSGVLKSLENTATRPTTAWFRTVTSSFAGSQATIPRLQICWNSGWLLTIS